MNWVAYINAIAAAVGTQVAIAGIRHNGVILISIGVTIAWVSFMFMLQALIP